jgi:hypothetical protein
VLVDEYQDTNATQQNEVLALLVGAHRALHTAVVMTTSRSIGWRRDARQPVLPQDSFSEPEGGEAGAELSRSTRHPGARRQQRSGPTPLA